MDKSSEQLIRYLLGELPEADSVALELEYFSDSQLFDRVVEAENDLVDRYARNQLPPETRQLFEANYLSHPGRRDRVAFASALATKIDPLDEAGARSEVRESWQVQLRNLWSRPAFAWAVSLALIAIVAGLAWFVFQTKRAREQANTRTAQEQPRPQTEERAASSQPPEENNRSRPQTTPTPNVSVPAPVFATLALNISDVRSGQTRPAGTLLIPAGTEKVRLQLTLPENDYSSYSIVVRTADGRQVFTRSGLRATAGKRAVLVTVSPAKIFASGDYLLTLKGTAAGGEVEDVSQSLFRVEKK